MLGEYLRHVNGCKRDGNHRLRQELRELLLDIFQIDLIDGLAHQ